MHQRSAQYQHRFCHYFGGDKGGRGSRQMAIKCNKGEGESKIGGSLVTYFLNDPIDGLEFKMSFLVLRTLINGPKVYLDIESLRRTGHKNTKK